MLLASLCRKIQHLIPVNKIGDAVTHHSKNNMLRSRAMPIHLEGEPQIEITGPIKHN